MSDVIVFHGGGQYLFWMLGVRDFLDTRQDTRGITMVGASSGAFCAVLTACGLSTAEVLKTITRLYNRHRPTSRLLGVCGIWSDMVAEGLDEVLPVDAHERCSGKTHIFVSRFMKPPMVVSTFESRKDLIECLMATAHVPFFMDYRPFRTFRGEWCYDGGWTIKSNDDYEVLGTGHVYHHFNYEHDALKHNSFKAHGTGVFAEMVQAGYDFAKKTF